jgi:hypothetical protein
MNSSARTWALVVGCAALGAIIGALVLIGTAKPHVPPAIPSVQSAPPVPSSTNAAIADTPAPKSAASFWREVPPAGWKEALMHPESHREPSSYAMEDAPILIQNLDLIIQLLGDQQIPPQSRFQLGYGAFSLSTLEIVFKKRPLSELNDQEKKILRTAITGLKTCYSIGNTVSPVDGMSSVILAVGLISNKEHNIAEVRRVLRDNGGGK